MMFKTIENEFEIFQLQEKILNYFLDKKHLEELYHENFYSFDSYIREYKSSCKKLKYAVCSALLYRALNELLSFRLCYWKDKKLLGMLVNHNQMLDKIDLGFKKTITFQNQSDAPSLKTFRGICPEIDDILNKSNDITIKQLQSKYYYCSFEEIAWKYAYYRDDYVYNLIFEKVLNLNEFLYKNKFSNSNYVVLDISIPVEYYDTFIAFIDSIVTNYINGGTKECLK